MRKHFRHSSVFSLLAGAALLGPSLAFAQLGGGFVAPTDALDTLNGASTGPSGAFGAEAIDRANAVAAPNPFADPAAGGDPGGNPFGAPADPNPFGAPAGGDPFGGGAAGGDPFGGGGAGASPFGASPFGASPFGNAPGGFAPALAAPATLRAWGGERITCHRTGQVLQDAREISILATASGNYFDDGQNGNDAVAGDNIYTNITTSEDFISPEAQLIKTKLIQTLEYASGLDAMNFFQVRVSTTEPTSPLAKYNDLQMEQDRKLTDWAQRFLRDYRINPDDSESEFYPTYLPPPPRAPNIPLPINFTPRKVESTDETGSAGTGAGSPASAFGDDSVTGEPIGNASSRYF